MVWPYAELAMRTRPNNGAWSRVGIGSEGHVRTTLMLVRRFAHKLITIYSTSKNSSTRARSDSQIRFPVNKMPASVIAKTLDIGVTASVGRQP